MPSLLARNLILIFHCVEVFEKSAEGDDQSIGNGVRHKQKVILYNIALGNVSL